MVRLNVGVLAAAQFLTRVPIRLRQEPSLTKAVPWFPVVGALIGAAVGGTAAGLWYVSTPIVAAAVAIALGLLITGAFHEDGLADCSDAFGGGWTIERRLEILKDPRHGSYGVAALCASIIVRIVAIGSLPGPGAMLWSAVAAHAVARGAAVGAMGVAPLARHDGLGADYARSLPAPRCIAGTFAGLMLAAGALAARWHDDLGTAAVALLCLTVAALSGAVAVSVLARRKIGGITGDVLGAVEQIVECLALVALASTRWP